MRTACLHEMRAAGVLVLVLERPMDQLLRADHGRTRENMGEHRYSGLEPGWQVRRRLCGKVEMVRVMVWKWRGRGKKATKDGHILAWGLVGGMSSEEWMPAKGLVQRGALGWSATSLLFRLCSPRFPPTS